MSEETLENKTDVDKVETSEDLANFVNEDFDS